MSLYASQTIGNGLLLRFLQRQSVVQRHGN